MEKLNISTIHGSFGISKSLRNPRKSVGIPLAKRIEMGNRDACRALLIKFGDEPSDIKDDLYDLLKLIEKNRRFETLSQIEIDRKMSLQKTISEKIRNNFENPNPRSFDDSFSVQPANTQEQGDPT